MERYTELETILADDERATPYGVITQRGDGKYGIVVRTSYSGAGRLTSAATALDAWNVCLKWGAGSIHVDDATLAALRSISPSA